MHQALFYVAGVWLTFLVGVCVVMIVRKPGATLSIVFVEVIALLLVAILILYSTAKRVPYYIDAAIALALLSFAGSLAAARFLDRGDVFGDE